MEDELLSVPQAAEELEITRVAVWRNIRSRALPATRVGRDFVIRRSDLEAFKLNRPKRGRPPTPRAHT